MILTIDIGNTTISFCIHNQEIITFKITSDIKKTADEYSTIIKPLLKEKDINILDIRNIAISSVVDEIKKAIVIMCEKYFVNAKLLIMKPKMKTKLDIAIDNSNELGNDLLAAAVAANKLSESHSFCVIDLGTATTISLVSNHKFLGVVIMPGFEKQLESLALSTSKLPKITSQQITQLIGKNTKDSILCGVIIGHAFAINNFIKKYQDKYSNLEIYITGGYNKWLLEYFDFSFELNDLLVHLGLKELISLNL